MISDTTSLVEDCVLHFLCWNLKYHLNMDSALMTAKMLINIVILFYFHSFTHSFIYLFFTNLFVVVCCCCHCDIFLSFRPLKLSCYQFQCEERTLSVKK